MIYLHELVLYLLLAFAAQAAMAVIAIPVILLFICVTIIWPIQFIGWITGSTERERRAFEERRAASIAAFQERLRREQEEARARHR